MPPSPSIDPAAPAEDDAAPKPKTSHLPAPTGQSALVTGVNSGIGRAAALGLACRGADIPSDSVTGTSLFVDGVMSLYPGIAAVG